MQAMPPVVDRAAWRAARDEILAREKAHTREGDAIAAARRRLPMTLMPPVTVTGADGPVPLLDVFDGRRMLFAYFHMWHDGQPWEGQCEGCTFSTCHMQMQEYLRARDVTLRRLLRGVLRGERAVPRLHGLHVAVVLRPGLATRCWSTAAASA